MVLKIEYWTDDGRPECNIVVLGNLFSDGVNSKDELLSLLVKPIKN